MGWCRLSLYIILMIFNESLNNKILKNYAKITKNKKKKFSLNTFIRKVKKCKKI